MTKVKTQDAKESQATRLIKLAASAELWHTPDGDAYATIPADGHQEHWPIRSKQYRTWLQRLYYVGSGGSANMQAVQDALGAQEGIARFDGPEHPVYVRVADHESSVYLDLANPTWQAVEIADRGWRLVTNPPVKFRRPKAMLPLPTPIKGGSIEDLRAFVNVADEDWPLLLGWLVAALYPRGPYPVLCFAAEQGSGKSTTSRVLRSLVDPNSAPLRCEPREPRDLMIAANNGRVVALDNVSHLPSWLSDALCRLSTGGGFSTRTLYENDEETIFEATRPTIVNGIEDVVSRGDLLDRTLMITLPTIPESKRRPEAEFWKAFEAARPGIFGVLLRAVAFAIKRLPETTLPALPRMADFALLATAAEPALGLKDGAFIGAYAFNRDDANALALEASPIANYIIDLAAAGEWTGTATELLGKLNRRANESTRKWKSWPKSAKALSGAIKRLAPNLRRAGVQIDQDRDPDHGRRRTIAIRMDPDFCVRTVRTVRNPENNGASSDASDAWPDAFSGPPDASASPFDGTPDASDASDASFRLHSDDDLNDRLAEAAAEDAA